MQTGLRWAMVRAFVLCVALPAVLAAASASAQVPTPAAHVVFVLPDGRPAIVHPDSGAVTMLATTPQRAAFPSWSPDGARVAYGTFAAAAARVDVADTRDGSVRSVYTSPSDAPIYLSWDPSGQVLAMLAVDRDGLALHLIDVASASSRLFARGSPFYWSWSRAGDRLLVHRDVLGVGALVGFTGLGDFEVAEPLPDPGVFQSPALSPSERYLAYATLSSGDVRRVVIAPAGGETRSASAAGESVTREVPHDGQASFAWHPRRDLLAIQRGVASGFGSISLLDAVTGDLEVVVENGSLAFFWSPDGGSIAYLTLRVVAPGFDGERQVRTAAAPNQGARIAINVLDVATGLVREIADFAPTGLFIEQFLPFFDQYARSHRVWSPRSDALVFSVLDDAGTPTITRFALDGAVTRLVAGEMPSFNVR